MKAEEMKPYDGPIDLEQLAINLPLMNISSIARKVRLDWKKPYFGAVPYLSAMMGMDKVSDSYGCDDGKSIILYFLSNASTWRGPVAKAIKAELNKRLKAKG